MQQTVNTQFYTYRQNNSGGYWENEPDKGIGHYVIIEALNSKDADDRAENIGIEFDTGCSCCGSRWSESWNDDGTDIPEIYGEDPRKMFKDSYSKGNTLIFVHYFDGHFEQILNDLID